MNLKTVDSLQVGDEIKFESHHATIVLIHLKRFGFQRDEFTVFTDDRKIRILSRSMLARFCKKVESV